MPMVNAYLTQHIGTAHAAAGWLRRSRLRVSETCDGLSASGAWDILTQSLPIVNKNLHKRSLQDFINLITSPGDTRVSSDPVEYSQSCKSRSAILLGIEWTADSEMLFLTNQGVELYTVLFEKRVLKKPIIFNLAMNWFVYSVRYHV